MNPALPSALAAALDRALEGVSRKELAASAQKMSAGYRQGQTSRVIVSPQDAIAYAVARMPATYAACSAVFARLMEAAPDLAPASLLDVGAGTGAASWAAVTAWPDIASLILLDHNAALRTLARGLAEAGPPALATAEILGGDLGLVEAKAEMIVASYVLAELTEDRAAVVATDLWQWTDKALVLIEPGTPQGFARIRAARAALIAAGAHVAAPCTHDNACPMTDGDWCHFSQRLPRSRDHMQMKDASVPFEDERYAYVAVLRDSVATGARILSTPLETKPGLTFKLCDATGLRAEFVAARDKDEYRRVRKKTWGDLF
jgi:ribosomal protein RSM22 (predicted rRNA methylase)